MIPETEANRACTDRLDSETKHKTLEEIAAAFGDRVVTLTDHEIIAKEDVLDSKASPEGFEAAEGK